jgi:glycosyltransferase involved in cell wall biosynthesis
MAKHYDGFLAPFCIAENGDKDTGPVVLKEAMAMSLPVITCDVMGCAEIVDDSVGYLVESRNTQALTRAINQYVHLSKEQRAKMRLAARARVLEKFDAFKQAKQLSNWIQQA